MSEWKTVRLGDVCEQIFAGGDASKTIIVKEKTKDYPIPVYANAVENDGLYGYTNVAKVTKPSLTISGRGTIGFTAKRLTSYYPIIRLITVTPKSELFDIGYFYYAVKNNNISSTGTSIPQLTVPQVENFRVLLPPLETQKQIAAQLDKCTTIIAKHKQMLEKYDTLIKSRFIEMFGDPVQNPMNWKVKKLGKMCSAIMNGTTPKGGEQVYVENGITFLRSQTVWRNKIDLEDVAYIDEATHNSMKKSSLKKYDILMTKTGRINTENSSLGRAALFMGEDDSANINGHVYLIRLEKEYNHEFVIRILTSTEYRDYIRSVCVGGIDKRQVNKDHIEDFPIIQPPKEMQEEYSNFAQQIDKSKFVVLKSLEKAETLYKSLMQEYFG